MNKQNSTKEYIAPQAEVIEVRVERGFQASGSEPEKGTERLTESGNEYTFS